MEIEYKYTSQINKSDSDEEFIESVDVEPSIDNPKSVTVKINQPEQPGLLKRNAPIIFLIITFANSIITWFICSLWLFCSCSKDISKTKIAVVGTILICSLLFRIICTIICCLLLMKEKKKTKPIDPIVNAKNVNLLLRRDILLNDKVTSKKAGEAKNGKEPKK